MRAARSRSACRRWSATARPPDCLRNYILRYFGEQPAAPCGNCGSCDNEFDEVDMTAAAKWMINCVAETARAATARRCGSGHPARREPWPVCGSWARRLTSSYGQLKDLHAGRTGPPAGPAAGGWIPWCRRDDQYAVLHIGRHYAAEDRRAQVLVKLPPQAVNLPKQRPKSTEGRQGGAEGQSRPGRRQRPICSSSCAPCACGWPRPKSCRPTWCLATRPWWTCAPKRLASWRI